MKRTEYPVKRVSIEEIEKAGVDLDSFPSAGPYANVTGMRRLYWEIDAPILRVGVYIYWVSVDVYNLF